jgi:hypothetical protein
VGDLRAMALALGAELLPREFKRQAETERFLPGRTQA